MIRSESEQQGYMKRAIELARIALSEGETPVGSLIVRNGAILGEGVEAVKTGRDISAHAEIIAIRRTCQTLETLNLSGCAIFTTDEPCFMCSYAIRQTRISQVVIGRPSPDIGGLSSLHPILSDPRISCWNNPPYIVGGVLQLECEALHV
ncbi:MAG: nucleoside deaminase [Candidatus Acidiferrales bacterium]